MKDDNWVDLDTVVFKVVVTVKCEGIYSLSSSHSLFIPSFHPSFLCSAALSTLPMTFSAALCPEIQLAMSWTFFDLVSL